MVDDLTKELKRLRKLEEKRVKALEAKRKRNVMQREIRELKYGKFFRPARKVRGTLMKGADLIQKQIKEAEVKKRRARIIGGKPTESYAEQLKKAFG